ncbi:Bgt-4328-2, partial [Blumeria graminis f. sp. tritici]
NALLHPLPIVQIQALLVVETHHAAAAQQRQRLVTGLPLHQRRGHVDGLADVVVYTKLGKLVLHIGLEL